LPGKNTDFLKKTLLVATLLLLFCFCFFRICNFDVGLHIRTGETIVKEASVPKYNIFSCANQEFRTTNDKWLFQVITYLIYSVFGFHGLVISRFLLLLGAVLLVGSIEFNRKHLLSTLIPVIAGLVLASERLFFRPDLASLFFLCLYLFLFMRERRTGNKLFLALIPLFHILWANIHGYFFVGLLLIAVFLWLDIYLALFGFLFKALFGFLFKTKAVEKSPPSSWMRSLEIDLGKSRNHILPYVCVLLLCIVASFVNPNGWRGAYFPIDTLLELRGEGHILYQGILEFLSPLQYIPNPSTAVILLPWFILGSAVIILAYAVIILAYFVHRFLSEKKKDVEEDASGEGPQQVAVREETDQTEEPCCEKRRERGVNLSYLIIFLLFLAMSLNMRRNITQFGLLSIPLLASVLNYFSSRFSKGFSFFRKGFVPTARILTLLVILFLLVDIASNRFHFRERAFKVFGSGVSRWALPEGGLSFVKEQGLKGNAFTSFGIGSYFVYGCFPHNLPFIDGNTFGYDIDFYRKFTNILNGRVPYQEIAEKHNINFFFLRFFISQEAIIPKLIQDPRWPLVYFDGVTCIFLKDTDENRHIIEKYEIQPPAIDAAIIERHIGFMDPYQGPWGGISRFLSGLFSMESRYPLISLNWARFFEVLGLKDKAIQHYRKAIAENRNFTEGYLNLGWIYKNRNSLKLAEQLTRKGLKITPHMSKGHLSLAFILESQGRLKEAEEEFKETVRANPSYAKGHYELGRLYANTERTGEAQKAYRKALKLDANFLPALAGYLRLSGGSVEEVRDIVLRHKKRNPLDNLPNLSLGFIAEREGDYEKGAEHFQAFLQANPAHGTSHFHLGHCYVRSGEFGKARVHLKRAIALNPGADYVANAQRLLIEIEAK